LNVLSHAGWEPGRSIDISRYVDTLTAEGFPVHETVREFLASFGGLHFPDRPHGLTYDDLTFDILEVTDLISPGHLSPFNDVVGTALCPVGVADGGLAFVAMDEHGRLLRYTEKSFSLLGPTPLEGLDALLNGRFASRML
jgi:hypothetical protein